MYKGIVLFSLILCLFLLSPAKGQGGIDLTWSSSSYVPVDYPGRALPSPGSQIEVVAMVEPVGSPLYFYWYNNGRLLEKQSGWNKFSARFITSRWLNREKIRLVVYDAQKNFLAEKETVIKIVSPQLIVSKKVVKAKNKHFLLTAKPYFFNHTPPFDYHWQINQTESQLSQTNQVLLKINPGQIKKGLAYSASVWLSQDKERLLGQAKPLLVFIGR